MFKLDLFIYMAILFKYVRNSFYRIGGRYVVLCLRKGK